MASVVNYMSKNSHIVLQRMPIPSPLADLSAVGEKLRNVSSYLRVHGLLESNLLGK